MPRVNQSTHTESKDALVITDISPVSALYKQPLEEISSAHIIRSKSPYTSTMLKSPEYFNVSEKNFDIPKSLIGKNLHV